MLILQVLALYTAPCHSDKYTYVATPYIAMHACSVNVYTSL